ncbi:MAG: Activator of (R)-2-hydroxyglutaryl-CoA dehydratase [Firmicutes bacterium]|nr:Activator of (R)-2-hydroxyglutaryl-CoA dehydratase [Bacillota bacterium]MDI6705065.1 CoA protein activase [Bacillota bacterium]
MKITFPHMGTSPIAFRMLIEKLGHQAVMPKRPSEKTLSLGSHYAPEFACLPFKILLGTYLEALEEGAEMVITSGGLGPCRAGYYAVLHDKILKDLGYHIDFVVLEPPQKRAVDFLKKLKKITSGNSMSVVWEALSTTWTKIKVLDEIESMTYEIRPFEVNKNETTKIFEECLKIIDAAWTKEQILSSKGKCLELLNSIPVDAARNPLKVGIIGEIYVVLEPAANFDIQRVLGEMGVIARRSIYLLDWTKDNTFFKGEEHIKHAAKPYLNQMVGGHGTLSVGNTVLYSREGYDGVIQLAPFACIPEIVSKSILNKVTKDLDIPLLTLFLDEQTGKAGINTRLEAFVDLMYSKRRLKQGVVV